MSLTKPAIFFLLFISFGAFANEPITASNFIGPTAIRLVSKAAPKSVYVLIESDQPGTQLFRIAGQSVGGGYVGGRSATIYTTFYEKICKAPCETNVENPAGDFYIAGEGITPSSTFDLGDVGSSAVIKVKTGRLGKRIGGFFLAYTGGALLLAGAIFIPIGILLGGITSFLLIAGIICASVGVAMLVPGIILIATSATKVDVVSGKNQPEKNGTHNALLEPKNSTVSMPIARF